MDRRHFNSILLAGGAVATSGIEADKAGAQGSAATGSSGFELLRLPEEYRNIFDQSYPRFSDGGI